MYKFETLIVWQKSKELFSKVIEITDQLPSKYRFSITSQLVRASLSVCNNLAEGSGRIFKKDKKYFYSIAQGSLLEVVNMLFLIRDQSIISGTVIKESFCITEEISKILHAILKK